MIDLIILGAGGFAREASLLVEEINEFLNRADRFNLLGFIENDNSRKGLKLRGYPIIGSLPELKQFNPVVKLICVIADPAVKKKIVSDEHIKEKDFINLIHPEVKYPEDVSIGKGVLINKGAVITTNIKIGDHVSINPACGIGHDTIIGNFSTLMWRVNLSGAVNLGEGCLVGTGVTILQNLNIGPWSKIGAGAVVIDDLPEYCTAVGVPARVIRQAGEVF